MILYFFLIVDDYYETRSPTNESYKSILAEMVDHVKRGHMQLEITEKRSIEKYIHEKSDLVLAENLILLEMLDNEGYNVLLVDSINEFNIIWHYLFLGILWIVFDTGPLIYWVRK